MKKCRFYRIFLLMLTLVLLAGCGEEKKEAEKQLSVCSSLSKEVTELFAKKYSEQNKVKVRISYLPGGTQKERFDYLRQNKFDLWLGGTAEEYYQANEQRLLEPYMAKEAYKVPAELRNRTGQWTSLYLNYVALLSNKNNLQSFGLYAPETWEELLTPELKNEIAMPDFNYGGASFGMITSIWQLKGREPALAYAAHLNAQKPQYTQGFGEAVDMVYIGKKTIAVVPLDYALQLEARHSHLFATVPKDANRNMLTCIALLRTAENVEEAQHFIDYLMSDEAVDLLKTNGFAYMWHVKNYLSNDGRRNMIGNIRISTDDLGWTAEYKAEIIKKWMQAG